MTASPLWVLSSRTLSMAVSPVQRELLVSSLIATRKSSGGFRPIAMGEAFYKLACLYTLNLVRLQIPDALGPLQFAFAPGGSETALHVLQAALDLHPDWVVISSDLSNAFNTCSRSHTLTTLFDTPALSPLFRLAHWS